SSERITAAKDGYFVASADLKSSPLLFSLQRLPKDDCEAYRWVEPGPEPAGQHNCANCHQEIYREWSQSGHSRSAANRRFVNLYDGTDWHGRPGKGWNLLAEHPDGAGVCTSCHAPTIRFDDPAYYDIRHVQGVDLRGVHCDYCHKVSDVTAGRVGWTHG